MIQEVALRVRMEPSCTVKHTDEGQWKGFGVEACASDSQTRALAQGMERAIKAASHGKCKFHCDWNHRGFIERWC